MPEENPYKILGLERDASISEVKKAYFKQVREYTPERHAEQFKKVRRAYEQLKDEKERLKTDLFLFHDPYGAFALEETDEDKGLPSVENLVEEAVLLILRSYSDLERSDFSADFTEV